MNVTTAIKSVNKQNLSQVWTEVQHAAKVFAVTLTIGAAMKLGLPSLVIESGVMTIQFTRETLLSVLLLALAIRATSDWMRR